MSQTEIFIYTKRRKSAILVGTAPNAFSGSVAVWDALSKKYLGCNFDLYSMDKTQELFNLADDERLTHNEHIVLASTCDGSICKPSGIKEFVDALREVNHSLLDDTGNLSVQADVIEQAVRGHKDLDCIAILRTSICCFDEGYPSKDKTWDIIKSVNDTEAKFAKRNAKLNK